MWVKQAESVHPLTCLQVMSALAWNDASLQVAATRGDDRMCVCVWERGSSSCVFMGVHTHVSEVEEGRFSQIVFQFLHHLFPILPPSFTLPHHFLSSHHLHSWLTLSHPFISLLPSSLSLSLSEVNAGSLQCSERVQHQEYVNEYWLMAGDLTNEKKKKRGTAVMGPLHGQ